MTPERDYLDFLDDIRMAALKAQSFVAGMAFADFISDEKTVYAVVRALEIVGEATKRLPSSIRDLAPAIPWRSMAGSRDKLVHDYLGVDLANVWHTVTVDLPDLEAHLEALVQLLKENPTH
jgi:uncharacterized protein with HEPN domain